MDSVIDVDPFLSSLRGGIRFGAKIATANPGFIYFLCDRRTLRASPNKNTETDANRLLLEDVEGISPSDSIANALFVFVDTRDDTLLDKMPQVAKVVFPDVPPLPPSTRLRLHSARLRAAKDEQDL